MLYDNKELKARLIQAVSSYKYEEEVMLFTGFVIPDAAACQSAAEMLGSGLQHRNHISEVKQDVYELCISLAHLGHHLEQEGIEYGCVDTDAMTVEPYEDIIVRALLRLCILPTRGTTHAVEGESDIETVRLTASAIATKCSYIKDLLVRQGKAHVCCETTHNKITDAIDEALFLTAAILDKAGDLTTTKANK